MARPRWRPCPAGIVPRQSVRLGASAINTGGSLPLLNLGAALAANRSLAHLRSASRASVELALPGLLLARTKWHGSPRSSLVLDEKMMQEPCARSVSIINGPATGAANERMMLPERLAVDPEQRGMRFSKYYQNGRATLRDGPRRPLTCERRHPKNQLATSLLCLSVNVCKKRRCDRAMARSAERRGMTPAGAFAACDR